MALHGDESNVSPLLFVASQPIMAVSQFVRPRRGKRSKTDKILVSEPDLAPNDRGFKCHSLFTKKLHSGEPVRINVDDVVA